MLDFATGQLTRKEIQDLHQQLKMQHQVSSDAKKAEAHTRAAVAEAVKICQVPVLAFAVLACYVAAAHTLASWQY